MRDYISNLLGKTTKTVQDTTYEGGKQTGKVAGAGLRGVFKGLRQGYQHAGLSPEKAMELEENRVTFSDRIMELFSSIISIVLLPLAIDNILFSLLVYLLIFVLILASAVGACLFIFQSFQI